MKKFLYYFLKLFFKIIYRVELKNPHKVQISNEKSLIIANHQSYLDGIILYLYLPVTPIFVINAQVAKEWRVRLILPFFEHITIDPSHSMSVKSIIRHIEANRPLVIFPEGRITNTGILMKIYQGPAFIVAKTQATIYPVRIDGAVYTGFAKAVALPKKSFHKITLTLMQPTKLSNYSKYPPKIARKRASDELRKKMLEMLFNTYKPTTLFRAFFNTQNYFPKSRKVIEDIKQIEYSYGDLNRMTIVLGMLLKKITQKNENVGVLLPNLAPTLAIIFALSNHQRVPSMLNFSTGINALINSCKLAEIKTIITSSSFIQQANLQEKVSELAKIGIKIYYLEDLRARLSIFDKLKWVFLYRLLPKLAIQDFDPEKPAIILFTSGSEGVPKGVILSHRAILANIEQIRTIIDINKNDKVLNALPMFHSFGLTAATLMPLFFGAKIHLHPSPLHYRDIPEIAYDKECTLLFSTNTFLANYGKYAQPYDFYKMRYVVVGAEKLTESVNQYWHDKFGIRILEGYGATEAAPVISVNTPLDYKFGTVGKFLPAIEYRLTKVEGIEDGGLLHIKAPNLKTGYLLIDNPGIVRPVKSQLGEGWYDTGDIVNVDDEGFLKIVGRAKRFAKIAGEMISLEVAENIARTASPDHSHAVCSFSDHDRGEILFLFTTDNNLSREQLQKVARSLGESELAVAKQIKYQDQIPLLGNGKTDYVRLQATIN